MYVGDMTLQDAREWKRLTQEDLDKHLQYFSASSPVAQQLQNDLEDINGRIAELEA
ncbi:hypothetical protein KIV63_gp14 [Mycobacterium phage SWU2]|uniref:Uncharacterized protein n=1 Tax=Mycobacterium phage SWU2 TaxID=2077150 RepID=A0A2K9VI71_9CAUD|nr:hypothetical protein KIV63_gp14 [Mycobacterium phage SWU2]AUV62030.1 hypothetical protein JX_gp71 [Mycobacterium phage SWU2]